MKDRFRDDAVNTSKAWAVEKFLHVQAASMSVLVKAAIVHVQFGRLLVTFLLCAEGVLRDPSLYLSLYLKRNRDTYYELLQQVRLAAFWPGLRQTGPAIRMAHGEGWLRSTLAR